MDEFPATERTKITRLAKRGSHEKETIYSILDEALFITLAFIKDNAPFQIATGHCRINDDVYVHGSVGSGYLRHLAASNQPVCIGATIIDGLVLARSAFHHSMNYRSVIVFSHAEAVTDREEIYHSLEMFTNKIQPGRWKDVRQPNEGEWKATMVLKFRIEEASARIRTGDPKDDEEGYQLPVWAGVVPMKLARMTPTPDAKLANDVVLPDYLT